LIPKVYHSKFSDYTIEHLQYYLIVYEAWLLIDIILQHEYGFRMPQAILKLIAEGKFVLPISTMVSPPMPVSPPLLQRESNNNEQSATSVPNNNSTTSRTPTSLQNNSTIFGNPDSLCASPD
jgi:hypothetical protein